MPDSRNWFTDYAMPAASLAAGVGNSFMNFFSQRQTNRTQIDLMREQNAFNERMMNKQMEWNDPRNQVQRLSAAGLNPALTFNDSSASVDMASAPYTPNLQAPQTSFSDVANNAASTFATIMAGNKDAEAAKGQSLNNLWINELNSKTLEKMSAEIGEKLASKDLSYAQRSYFQSLYDYVNTQQTILQGQMGSLIDSAVLANEETRERIKLIQQNKINFEADTALKRIQNKLLSIQVKFEPQRLQAVISNLVADTASKWSQSYMYNAYGSLASTQELLTSEQRFTEILRQNGIEISNEQAQDLYPLLREAQQETINTMRTTNASTTLNMALKPFDIGGGLVRGIGMSAMGFAGSRSIGKDIMDKKNPFSGVKSNDSGFYNFNH